MSILAGSETITLGKDNQNSRHDNARKIYTSQNLFIPDT